MSPVCKQGLQVNDTNGEGHASASPPVGMRKLEVGCPHLRQCSNQEKAMCSGCGFEPCVVTPPEDLRCENCGGHPCRCAYCEGCGYYGKCTCTDLEDACVHCGCFNCDCLEYFRGELGWDTCHSCGAFCLGAVCDQCYADTEAPEYCPECDRFGCHDGIHHGPADTTVPAPALPYCPLHGYGCHPTATCFAVHAKERDNDAFDIPF